MTQHTPPAEFAQLGLFGNFISLRGGREWHGPCPFCPGGGGVDRFRIHTDKPFPKWNWACRKCGKTGWADQLNTSLKQQLDPARLEFIRQAEAERAAARKAEILKAIEGFTVSEVWEALHERMTQENYAWWEKQGIPPAWADFWKLGYTDHKTFEHDGAFFTSPAYTIPKFDLTWKPTNMDYRLLEPPLGVGKYRPANGLPAAAFYSRPDKSALDDEVYIVEGSKKAMVVSISQDPTREAVQVIGVPSKNSWAGVEERVKDCGRVWVILDPDGQDWARKLAKGIGKNARVVELPTKPDDAFTQHGMQAHEWRGYLRYARRVS